MNKKNRSLFSVFLKEEIIFLCNDRIMQILLLVMPLILLISLFLIFDRGVVQQVPVAIIDYDHSSLSRNIIINAKASRSVKLVDIPNNATQAKHLMRTNKIYAYLEIPPRALRSIHRNQYKVLSIHYNAQFRSIGNTAASGLQSAVSNAISSIALDRSKQVFTAEKKLPLNLEISSISNPQSSYERFLEPLAIPVILNIILSSAVICAMGRSLSTSRRYRCWTRRAKKGWLAAVIGRTLPYIIIVFLWHLVCLLWFSKVRGWPILGNSWVLMLAIFAMCCATSSIAILLITLTRQIPQAMGISTVYTSAALTYSGGTLSELYANAWTRFWVSFQPFTHYYRAQLQQINLGSDILISFYQIGILLLYIFIPLFMSYCIYKKNSDKPLPSPELIDTNLTNFKTSYIVTIKDVFKCKSIFSTSIISIVLYSFFYPAAYSVQINKKVPVAVVNRDHSTLSAQFIKNLQSTRTLDVVLVTSSSSAASKLLINNKIVGNIIIDDRFKYDFERGSQSGVYAQINAGYMAVSPDIKNAISSALSSTHEINSYQKKAAVPISTMPLYNVSEGYETFVMPLVFIIILQQTLLFGGSMLTAQRRDQGLLKMTCGQFFGSWMGLATICLFTSSFIFGPIYWLKGYPNEGSIFVQFVMIILFALASSAMALLIGSFFKRIYHPMQLFSCCSMVIFYASGASFPQFNMPNIINYGYHFFPSTVMINGFSTLNSQGATFFEMLPVAVDMSIVCIILLFLAMCRLVFSPEQSVK